MILILEILLTVSAFKKGWGWKALLPFGVLIVAAFIMGAYLGANGKPIDSNLGLGLLLDGALLLVLIVMNAVAPNRHSRRIEKGAEIPFEAIITSKKITPNV